MSDSIDIADELSKLTAAETRKVAQSLGNLDKRTDWLQLGLTLETACRAQQQSAVDYDLILRSVYNAGIRLGSEITDPEQVALGFIEPASVQSTCSLALMQVAATFYLRTLGICAEQGDLDTKLGAAASGDESNKKLSDIVREYLVELLNNIVSRAGEDEALKLATLQWVDQFRQPGLADAAICDLAQPAVARALYLRGLHFAIKGGNADKELDIFEEFVRRYAKPGSDKANDKYLDAAKDYGDFIKELPAKAHAKLDSLKEKVKLQLAARLKALGA